MIQRGDFRFSVLSSRIFRIEKDKKRSFTDEATQTVVCRSFDRPKFTFSQDGYKIKIATTDAVLRFDLSKGRTESITLRDSRTVTDFSAGNLGGTYRTLDMINGSVKLGDGLMSTNGVSVIDDSKTVIMCKDGTMKERRKVQKDEYYFAFGSDYRGCLREFFKLCGPVPLIPRYCLGNWWSRYKDYSQQEYIDLMQKFIEKEIPVSVATIDMDWHWVDVIERFGKENAYFRRDGLLPYKKISEVFQSQGWTGYSWNTELFPDYKALLGCTKRTSRSPSISTRRRACVRLRTSMRTLRASWVLILRQKSVSPLISPTRSSLRAISAFYISLMKTTALTSGG